MPLNNYLADVGGVLYKAINYLADSGRKILHKPFEAHTLEYKLEKAREDSTAISEMTNHIDRAIEGKLRPEDLTERDIKFLPKYIGYLEGLLKGQRMVTNIRQYYAGEIRLEDLTPQERKTCSELKALEQIKQLVY